MANFPTSLPSITNPTASDTLAGVPHHTQHGTANDEIAALAAKLGIVASTPVIGDTLSGTATGSSRWVQGVRTIRQHGAAGDLVLLDLVAESRAGPGRGEGRALDVEHLVEIAHGHRVSGQPLVHAGQPRRPLSSASEGRR